jgi:hypothetical protein
MRCHQERGEKPSRGVGKRIRVGFIISSFFGLLMSRFHPSLVRHAYKIDSTKHSLHDPYF